MRAVSKRTIAWLALILVSFGLRLVGQAGEPVPAAPALKGYDPNGGAGKRIIEIPITETIDLGLAAFVDRALKDAKPTDVVILNITTFGGRIDAAVQIRDRLLQAKIPTVAFINQRAISAGALISLACDTILMTPNASIGAATPVQIDDEGKMNPTTEKVVSYMRAEMRSTAEAKGRRGDLAEAMVDADVEIPGVDPQGKLLTLTTDRAVELKLADASVADYNGALELLNLKQAEQLRQETALAERFARFITDPMVSSLLMTIGTIALAAELYTPGIGIGGFIAVLCFALFFGGQYTASLAGWEELVVFLVGVGLIAFEVLVIPGHGLVAVVGICIVIAAIIMSMVELRMPLDVSLAMGYLQEMIRAVLLRLMIAVIALGVCIVMFARVFGKTKLGRQLILQTSTDASAGFVTAQPPELVGKRGRVSATLRPAGVAEIDGQRVDVVSVGEYIERGTDIEVISVDGNRVVVRSV